MLGQQDKGDSSREEGFLKPLVYQSQPAAPRQSVAFTSEDSTKLKSYLDAPVDACEIQFRPSAQGSVAYIEGWKALSLANEAFGFNGWSSEILQLGTDFLQVESGRVSLGVTCVVRVTLRDGTFHEDIGYGSAENQKSKAGAFEKARKEAVTDAMKRALRMFGNRLGNCAYDKAFLRQVRSGTLPQKRPPAAPPSTEMPPSRMPLTNMSNVKISENVPPADFVPKWQHPKASGSHGGPNPQVNPNQAQSDFDSELVMTEEQDKDIEHIELDFPPPPKVEPTYPLKGRTLHHYRSPRSETKTNAPAQSSASAINVPPANFGHLRPPPHSRKP